MSVFTPGIARAPNLLLSRAALGDISRTNVSLFQQSTRLATGLRISAPSEDAVAAAAVTTLDARLERSSQRLRNLDFASGSLDTLDASLGETSDLLEQAKSLSIAQLNIASDPSERASQSTIVESMIASLFRTSNQRSLAGYVFGGTRPGEQPVQDVGGAFRFSGERGGLTPDLGLNSAVPITIGALNSIGSVSSRVRGYVDLEPQLTPDTRIVDLRGAQSVGIQAGNILLAIDEDEPLTIDLSDADTIGDVVDRLAATVRRYEEENEVDILGPGGITLTPTAIQIDTNNSELVFQDLDGGTTARDLGLTPQPTESFNDANPVGEALEPMLTMRTPISALGALNADLGAIRITNNARTVTVDLSSAETVGDVRSLIEATGLGVRVELNEDRTGFNIVTEISGGADHALSISDAGDNTGTASALGIRTLSRQTLISDFNFGKGVDVLEGDPDPDLNVDFTITLGDGFEIPIDLSSGDMTTAGTLIDELNTQINAALAAAGRPATDLGVSIANTENGFALTQGGGIAGAVTIQQRNNSPAARQLGLLSGTWDAGNGRLVSEDRSKVRVDSVFTHLIDLRDALKNNDTFGIQLASESLDRMVTRVAETRAQVGGYAQRVEAEVSREEERSVLDSTFRSQLRDTDFAAASSEYALLQTQLEAGLRVAAVSGQLSLLSFLG